MKNISRKKNRVKKTCILGNTAKKQQKKSGHHSKNTKIKKIQKNNVCTDIWLFFLFYFQTNAPEITIPLGLSIIFPYLLSYSSGIQLFNLENVFGRNRGKRYILSICLFVHFICYVCMFVLFLEVMSHHLFMFLCDTTVCFEKI